MKNRTSFKEKWKKIPLPCRFIIGIFSFFLAVFLLFVCYVELGYFWARNFGGITNMSYSEDGKYYVVAYNNTPFIRFFNDIYISPTSMREAVKRFHLAMPFGIIYVQYIPFPEYVKGKDLLFSEIHWVDYGLWEKEITIGGQAVYSGDGYASFAYYQNSLPLDGFSEMNPFIKGKLEEYEKSFHTEHCWLPRNALEHFIYGRIHE